MDFKTFFLRGISRKALGLISLVLVSFVVTNDALGQADFITNVRNRTIHSLNGKWKYVMDQYETGQIGFSPIFKNTRSFCIGRVSICLSEFPGFPV
jgi:hypothetical protein